MSLLHEIIAARVDTWRAKHYPCKDYPAIGEFLQFAYEDEQTGQLRYLRKAQFRALEVYWYLRLVVGSPKIPELYEQLFPKKPERREALGISNKIFEECEYEFATLFDRIRADNAFVRANQLESLRETLTLDYPSYILALAMGAGKTILIGSIVATEFAMAQEYTEGPFVKNALIFAPGKTIIESLREISDIPFDKIIPARFYKLFAASLKLTFTRDGDKELSGVIDGSEFNLIVTNTEKIRIQKPTSRGNANQLRLFADTKAEEAEEIANLRLQKIASLPHLAVFSDEAHHTYGQKLLGRWEKDADSGEMIFKEQGIKIEAVLAHRNLSPTILLAVDAKSTEAVKSEFYRLAHDPHAQHRIVLLVNMGTEGWNCPSLFACGLVRRLAGSNNFVLQAATRCLRQVPGNDTPARVYVSKENEKILNRQLEETYGTSISDLNKTHTERVEKEIRLHQPNLPPLLVKRRILRFKRKAEIAATAPLSFTLPQQSAPLAGHMETWSIAEVGGKGKLTRIDSEELSLASETLDVYTAAGLLAANYHLPTTSILAALRTVYDGSGGIPAHHLDALGHQIEAQRRDYEEDWQEVEIPIALVKLDGFRKSTDDTGESHYTAQISFEKPREHLYRLAESFPHAEFAKAKSFHYEGYNFDSEPEADYLEEALNIIAQHADNIEGIWFTGGLTDPSKTDLYAEYKGEDGRWHRYTPDFVIRRKDGKSLIVEIKDDRHQAEIASDMALAKNGEVPKSKEGRKAVAMSKLAELNPDQLGYKIVFAGNVLPAEAMAATRKFVSHSLNDGNSPWD